MEPTLVYLGAGAFASASALIARLYALRGDVPPERWRSYKRIDIADAVAHRVQRICGTLEYIDSAPLVAPLSGRQCAYYEVTVEEFGPPDGVGWVTRHVGREMKDFFVRDSTARARVCPSSPTVMLDIDEKVVPQFFKKRPPSVQRLLDQLPDVTIDDPECVCIREGVLEAGETITVMGGCYWEADEAQHMYRDMGRRLVIGATDEGDMFLSDRKIKR